MLLDAIPDIHMSGRARNPVQGEVPNPLAPPSGCSFHPRCPHANERCKAERPAQVAIDGAMIACHAVQEAAHLTCSSGGQEMLAAKEIDRLLAIPDQPRGGARHHHLGRAAARVVVARHAHAYAPADSTATKSPGSTASDRSRPSQSPDSQTGPTTSQLSGGASRNVQGAMFIQA